MDEGFKVIETHVSRLIFADDRVYKIKKPVQFGFVDLSTRTSRQVACEAEVSLNSRLASDVYEGVGTFIAPDGSSEPVVVMKRLPESRSLTSLIRTDDPHVERHLRDIAATLAEFHRRGERSPRIDSACTPTALLRQWQDSTDELRSVSAGILDPEEIDRAMQSVRQYLEGRQVLLEERIESGRPVDGHGDLLCDDIFCLRSGTRILDCLEFSPVLRFVDPLSDVASLAMDLEDHGRPDLAATFFDSYRKESGDSWPPSLAHLYVAYRASVRAKVACLRAGARDRSESSDIEAARRLFELTTRHLEAAAIRLILVGGLPGTGKSTLAHHIHSATGWPVLSSDLLRKRLAGLNPEDDAHSSFGTGLYAPEATATVYSELLEEAGALLRRGYSVVLDASWIRKSWRDAASDLADRVGARMVSLHCEAGEALTHHRIRERHLTRGSDATVAIADAMSVAVEPWIEAVSVDTSTSITETVVVALEVIGIAN